MTILQTRRLQLDHFTTADASFMLALLNSPGWLTYIGDRHVKTVHDAEAYISDKIRPSYQTFNFGFYVMRRTHDQKPMGICGLVKREKLEHVDLGYALLPEYFGQGYAIEAARAVLAFAKNELQLPTIAAITVPENQASVRLLQKLGFQFKKYLEWLDESTVLSLYEH